MKIKKGDIIKIVHPGCIYPTYVEMAEQLGADFDKWTHGNLIYFSQIGKQAKVLNINKDRINTSSCHILIEMIEGAKIGEQYVIGADGIKLDVIATILDDDLFDI